MCEIIRTFVVEGKFKDTGEFDQLNEEWIGQINCAGSTIQT